MSEPYHWLSVVYKDNDHTVYWVADEAGRKTWFEIDGNGLERGVKNVAYVKALAAIGERFLQHSIDEDMYTDLTHE